MNRTIPRLASAALAGCITLGLASPATAQDSPPTESSADAEQRHLPELKTRCLDAIDQRLDHLARAQTGLDAATSLTDHHEAALDGIIDATESELTGLRAAVEAAGDATSVVELCATVAPDYRVYLVVLPQAHLTVGADRSQAGAEIGYEVIDTLDHAIEAAAKAGADVALAQELRDRSLGHLEAADGANDGVADTVLAVTPESYNAGPGAEALTESRSHLRRAHAELVAAEKTGTAAARALRDALDDLA